MNGFYEQEYEELESDFEEISYLWHQTCIQVLKKKPLLIDSMIEKKIQERKNKIEAEN